MRRRTKLIVSVASLAALVTAITVVVVLNLGSDNTNVAHPLETNFRTGDPLFVRTMSHMLGPPLMDGNQVEHLENGDEVFPAMLDAIGQAQRSINFETYVYWTGNVAVRFAEALAAKARDGVQVRVLLDAFGARKMDPELIEVMTEAGAMVEQFRPLRWYSIGMQNNRTHRKLLIVDGEVGFTGGVGIAEEWTGDAQDKEHWRDSHFRVTGPVVAQMQSGFADNWMQARGELIQGTEFFPDLDPVGDATAQAFNSSAEGGSEGVRVMYLLSIAAAERRIRIGTPYFVPDDFLLDTLLDAIDRGVNVQVLVPGHNNDSYLARFASRTRWGELLEAGAEIHVYEPTFYHTKVMIVDDLWVSVGSTNFDMRSFRYNDENNLNVLDREFARQMNAMFDRDLADSRRVTIAEWRNRPWSERFTEWWTGTLAAQL